VFRNQCFLQSQRLGPEPQCWLGGVQSTRRKGTVSFFGVERLGRNPAWRAGRYLKWELVERCHATQRKQFSFCGDKDGAAVRRHVKDGGEDIKDIIRKAGKKEAAWRRAKDLQEMWRLPMLLSLEAAQPGKNVDPWRGVVNENKR